MKKIILLLSIFSSLLTSSAVISNTVNAADIWQACGSGSGSVCEDKGKTDVGTGVVKPIVDTLLWIIGIVSVVVIIFGGIRIATSAGQSSAVTNGKNMVLGGVIGLIIAVLAYAIVNLVYNQFRG